MTLPAASAGEPSAADRNPRRAAFAAVTAAFLGLITLVALSLEPRAEPVGKDAPRTAFSSARAWTHLEAIAREPRFIGTKAHSRARDYLRSRLEELGLEVQVQQAISARRMVFPWSDRQFVARVQNIVGRSKGSQPGRSVLVVAHYDSVPGAPGAADDGSGVAAILEAVRAARAAGPLRNDLIVLLTDGEEVALLGAQAFLRQHPWMADVAVVLNFEARGSSGPVLLFETGPENGWLVRRFAEVAPHPAGNSLAAAVYRSLPNDTDFSVFRDQGAAGLNFAFIRNLSAYHTAIDDLDRLDPASLQHQGEDLLALIRDLGDADLSAVRDRDAVFFDLAGFFFVYSQDWAVPLAAAEILGFLVVLVLGFRSRRLSARGIARAAVALLAALAAAPLVVAALSWLAPKFDPVFELMAFGEPYDGRLYCLAAALLAAAVPAAAVALGHRRFSLEELAAGGLLLWQLPVAASALALPGGSYLFLWPAAGASLGLASVLALPHRPPVSAAAWSVLAFASLPGLLLFVPLIDTLFVALTFRLAAVVAVVQTLLLILLSPQLYLLAGWRRWLPATGLAGLGLVVIASAALAPNFGPRKPRPNSLFYVMDQDLQEARWVTRDAAVDDWTAQVLGPQTVRTTITRFLPTSVREYLQAPAPVLNIAAPEVRLIEEAEGAERGGLDLRLWVRSPRGAPMMDLEVSSENRVLNAVVAGTSMDAGPDQAPLGGGVGLSFFGVPPEGFELLLRLDGRRPVTVHAVDQSFGLPDGEAGPLSPRPQGMMPQLIPQTDSTFLGRKFEFWRSENVEQ